MATNRNVVFSKNAFGWYPGNQSGTLDNSILKTSGLDLSVISRLALQPFVAVRKQSTGDTRFRKSQGIRLVADHQYRYKEMAASISIR